MKWLHRGVAAEPPLIDTGYLDRLLQHLGPAVTAELLADGLLELTDRLARLGELAERGELAAIARSGHDIIGTAGHLGLTRLSIAAVDMNRAARALTTPDGPAAALEAAAVIERVRALGAPSLAALAGRLAGEPPP